MSKSIYSPTNYRKNLVLYWRQFYPLWDIPVGYHVHHIIPRKLAEQKGWPEERINHPRNLIALHPDDHMSIHLNRGDHCVNSSFLSLNGLDRRGENNAMYGRTGKNHPRFGKRHSEETICKLRELNIGKPISEETRQKLREYNTGRTLSEETKRKISIAMKEKPRIQNPTKNSQYGTMWITNDSKSKKIKKGDPIPDGWRKGRVMV